MTVIKDCTDTSIEECAGYTFFFRVFTHYKGRKLAFDFDMNKGTVLLALPQYINLGNCRIVEVIRDAFIAEFDELPGKYALDKGVIYLHLPHNNTSNTLKQGNYIFQFGNDQVIVTTAVDDMLLNLIIDIRIEKAVVVEPTSEFN